MTNDPIVEEVRAVREQIASENHYNLVEIFAALRKLEGESDRPHIILIPFRIPSKKGPNET